MDVVVGVAVAGRVARLAMVGAGGQVIDQYALDLPDDSMTDLADTVVGTYREVANSGNRVAATRLCLPDASAAATLRQTVSSAGVPNVEVVAEADAAAALARSVGADAALLLADDDTVSLTVVGEDDESTSVLASLPIGAAGAAVACATVLQQAHTDATRIMLIGQRLDLNSIAAELHSTAPVEVPPDGSYAIARGAAQTAADSGYPAGAATMMAPAAAEATMMAPASDATQMAPAAADATQMAPSADPAAVGPQLAYSQEEPGEYELPFDSLEEFVPELEDEEAYTAMIAPPPRKTLLMGSALAFVVVAFATLAVSVAVTIRPVADVQAQPAPSVQSDTVPGRYLPPVPHEPDPVALPIAEVSPAPAAPAAPSVRTNRGPNSVAPEAPAPQAPPPEPGPAPEVPGVPIPPVIPFPPFNPFPTLPTWTTTVTTTPTTTTTTTSTTTTTTTPTTTTTTPTTTTSETTTSSSTPTTIPTSQSPPPVIEKTAPPASQEPASQAPALAPAYTPPAVAPEPAPAPAPAPVIEKPVPAPVIEAPSSGSGSSSGSGGSGSTPVTTIPVSP